ncbi:LytR family transcriptional regulator [Streptococcus loxodontisalivarius]|uniref:Csm6 HEPN domain-containing protein n=1 Tax=Streptococcus loxodontisalivarius TaxID=1349415 RepID=A0ABS2PP00_9STRE|nr:LytR family transcriptional regulator [Streptococcus loxodontisalivarius]MBM7641754.1 hypothetical protein [Streptococcus loxodontisalivarius]
MKHREILDILLDVYSYSHALTIAEQLDNSNSDLLFLLKMMSERRELNLDYSFQHQNRIEKIEASYHVKLLSNNIEEERLANYLMDLEAKLANDQLIDFVRAVSPIIYRLFYRLAQQFVPDLSDYIHNSKDYHYDSWDIEKMSQSSNPYIKKLIYKRIDSKVKSQSLLELLQYCQLSDEVQASVKELRRLEKTVRNPLAHLIKPFDEEELAATTGFSSQDFMSALIVLAQETGINYSRQPFYYDYVNQLIKTIL